MLFRNKCVLLPLETKLDKEYMREKTANWFETTVRYERQADDNQKKVTETYVVEAVNFGEAEEIITRETAPFVTGDFQVKSIAPAAYGEIFFSDNEQDDKWYKAKVAFITMDEKTSKEKRSVTTYLVQAGSFNSAVKNVDAVEEKGLGEYQIVNISETKIMDVYEYQVVSKKQEVDDKPEYEAQDEKK